MTDQERDEARAVQDELLALAERMGYPTNDNIRVAHDVPPDVTLRALRELIFPDCVPVFRRVIRELQGLERQTSWRYSRRCTRADVVGFLTG